MDIVNKQVLVGTNYYINFNIHWKMIVFYIVLDN